MQTPELLLSKLNQALRELRGAARVLDNDLLDVQLLQVMRRLTLAEIMNERWLVAVGGTQGAGKTTLVRTLYDLGDNDPWLPANEGRGETLPILIQESADHAAPRGYAMVLRAVDDGSHHFMTEERPLEPDAFVQACRGKMAEVLLPVLRVPRRHFQHDGQALILLPGYEKRSADNGVWQDLMRQALLGAAGCIIVTDATRMANQGQQEVVKDMLANELRTVRPLIVVAKTEALRGDAHKLTELRQTAVATFELEGDDALERVFCAGVGTTGSGADVAAPWLADLSAALRDMSLAGSASRQVQLARLEQTLSVDLAAVLREVRTHATLSLRQSGGGSDQEVLKECLDAFDDACTDLRAKHQQMVIKLTGAHYAQAWEQMQTRLENEHEGFWNKITGTLDTVTETQRKLEQDVLASWDTPGPLLQQYTAGLAGLTARVAGPALAPANLPASATPLQRLGYIDDKNLPVAARFTDATTQANLRTLLRSRAGDVASGPSNRELERTVRLLPAMVLEYTRIASALPQLVQVSATTLARMPQADLAESAGRMKQQFSEFADTSGGILKGIAAVMAVDIAADGHADIIDTLLSTVGVGSNAAAASTGTAAGAAGLTIGGAVAGAIAIGYLAHSALQEVRRHDGQVRGLAESMMQHIRDHHQVHFGARYDDLMSTMRSHLKDGLRRRYGMDLRLEQQDRLQKALADVRVLQQDLLSQLASSGHTLALFDTAAA
ncbi:hypothetical protein [Massilia aquatica]|uniref:Sugar kinase n=1 Tax=Massilia aquatica TaxID=2609000 RepID=A0ABX0MDU8_9BURK|nr:hypothetical protein [Massilia aquatica]NHZ42136.1 hypothetical protein [Massilia aquatica]